MKIIVIDDEINALKNFLEKTITFNKYDFKYFVDDKEAIFSYVKSNEVISAFIDIKMPNINGIELASKLIDINPKIKILFITGLVINKNDLPLKVAKNTIGFLYKPYDSNLLNSFLNIISKTTPIMYVRMIESFDCFIDDKIVNFSSSKSKELFALLLVYNGKTLEMSDAISQIWEDKNVNSAKILYRDAVWRLRKTLSDINFNCVTFKRGAMQLNKENIQCDYWDLLLAKKKTDKSLLKSYSWSLNYESLISLDDTIE